MDSSKAKSILVIVFLALNVFLLGNIVIYSKGEHISTQTLSYTTDILKNNGVKLECKIPTQVSFNDMDGYDNKLPEEHKLAETLLGSSYTTVVEAQDSKIYQNGSRELRYGPDGKITYRDSNPADSPNLENNSDVEKYVKSFINKAGLPGGKLVADGIKRNGDGTVTLVMKDKYKGYYIFDNYAKCTLSQKGVTELECRLEGFKSVNSKNIIPAYQILIKNFSESSGTTITGIELGFMEYKLDDTTKGWYAKPVWRVKISGGKPRYFKALESSDGSEVICDYD